MKRILEEDELCYVIRDGFPVTDRHTLVIPKRHVETYFDLYQPELNSCNRMIQKFKERIEKGIRQSWGSTSESTTEKLQDKQFFIVI